MAAPTAPLPLWQQVKSGTSMTIAFTLRSIGPAPGLVDGAAGFNNGDPTATFTVVLPPAIPGGASGTIPNEVLEILHNVEDMWANGLATVA